MQQRVGRAIARNELDIDDEDMVGGKGRLGHVTQSREKSAKSWEYYVP